jgi:hypothetical protein
VEWREAQITMDIRRDARLGGFYGTTEVVPLGETDFFITLLDARHPAIEELLRSSGWRLMRYRGTFQQLEICSELFLKGRSVVTAHGKSAATPRAIDGKRCDDDLA